MKTFDILVAGPPDIVQELLGTSLRASEDGSFSFTVDHIPGQRRLSGEVEGRLVPSTDGVRLVGTSRVHRTYGAVMLGAAMLGTLTVVNSVFQRGFHLETLWLAWFGQSVLVGLLYWLYDRADAWCAPVGERRVEQVADEVRQMLEAYCTPEEVVRFVPEGTVRARR
ncbi:MAG: hypothetical protein H6735_03490 [Alphaproteobacteria bacterium]|nr:hypothetical protein [Alphaproteobacteria bacterium]